MIISLYILSFPIREIFEKDMKLSKKIALFHLTHLMSMADLVAIDIKISRIDSG